MKTFLQALIAAILLLTTSGRPSSDEELDKLLEDLAEEELIDSEEPEPVYEETREEVYHAGQADEEDFSKYHIPGLTKDGYFNGQKVKSITEIGGQPIEKITPLETVLPVLNKNNVTNKIPLKKVSPLKSVRRLENVEEVRSLTPIKRIEEVIKRTPLKSVQEIKSIEEVKDMIPIDDDVAENMLKELGLSDDGEKMEAEETYSPGSRRQNEEFPYKTLEDEPIITTPTIQEPIYEEESAVSTVGDIQRILALLGISSFDQIKKITPIKSMKEVTSMRELNSDEISQLDGIIGKEKKEVAIQQGKLEEYSEKEYKLDRLMAAEIEKIKKIDDAKQIYEIKKMEQIAKIEELKQMIEIKKMERVKSIQKIKSMQRIKSKHEIKQMLPIKSIEEVKSIKEVKDIKPILRKYNLSDEQAQRIINAQRAKTNGNKYYEERYLY